jgi:predicted lipoprotein with Yx(FWY)xxD motif
MHRVIGRISIRGSRPRAIAIAAAATGLLVSACGSSSSVSATPAASMSSTAMSPAASDSTSASASGSMMPSASDSMGAATAKASKSSAMGAASLKAHSGALGTYLTDSKGHALYLYTSDTSHKSACTGACVMAWPPLTTAGTPMAAMGMKASLIGTITRSGGIKQVTYAGHPLYYFAKDTASGVVKGQGVGKKWWIVSPSGAAIKKMPAMM